MRLTQYVACIKADLSANSKHTGAVGFMAASIFVPGFRTTVHLRTAQLLYQSHLISLRLIGRLLGNRLARHTSCFFGLSSVIGPGLVLPHPTGIVIGEGCRIGANVTIYQNVTLGTAHRDASSYPVVESGCTIYAGAVIVGGITIGASAIVGALTFVNHDIPRRAIAAGSTVRLLGRVSS